MTVHSVFRCIDINLTAYADKLVTANGLPRGEGA